jgi:hypothetical protein
MTTTHVTNTRGKGLRAHPIHAACLGSRGNAGASLIEVLLASIVLSMGTLALLSVQGLHTAHVRQESDRRDAQELTHDAIEQHMALLAGVNPQPVVPLSAVQVDSTGDEPLGLVRVRAWRLGADTQPSPHQALALRWVPAPSLTDVDETSRMGLSHHHPASWPVLAPVVPAP